MISELHFSLLVEALESGYSPQRALAEKFDVSVGTINNALKELIDANCITSDMRILDGGVKALEPYKVDNAVIMAAGMSSRFAPLSYEKPKGLMIVKDSVLIEREIEQLQAAGITDITLVVGYMKEKFFYLEDKYNITIRINEDYYRYNNTSSLIEVLDKLGNTYICSSDNYFSENVFTPYVYRSYYSAIYQEGSTDEYCLSINSKGLITHVSFGGSDSWIMLGHVYFDRSFSATFKEILQKEYTRSETKQRLWEDLYARYVKELPLYIQKYPHGIINEFDSLDELRQFDPLYIKNTDSNIMKNICTILSCKEEDIQDIHPIKQGLTNTSFHFECNGHRYVYRHPGPGTEKIISRVSEAFSMKIAKNLGLDDTFITMDEQTGWKLSHYLEESRTMDYANAEERKQALSLMRRLHDANLTSEFDYDMWSKAERFITLIGERGRAAFEDFDSLYTAAHAVYQHAKADNIPKRLCHCDCYDTNFLIDTEENMHLIDWEYSGNDDPGVDLGTFICCYDFTDEEAIDVIHTYAGKELPPKELRHWIGYVAITSYHWFLWAIYQESVGSTIGSFLYLWYRYAKRYSVKALDLYEATT